MALVLNIGKCTLLGNYRENNEDAIDVKQFPELTLSMVADGMGGQAAGEIASKRATEVVPRELKKNLAPDADPESAKQIIRKAVVQANEEIIAMGALDRDLRNMGTTVVLAVWRKDKNMFVTGVGDSRAYLIRGGKIEQLTVDHSLAQATDGLSGVVSDDKIMSCVEENTDVQKCADALGQLALDSGSRDNVSCIVIEVAEG